MIAYLFVPQRDDDISLSVSFNSRKMSVKTIGGDFKVIKTFSKGAMGDVFLVEKETIPFPLILKSCKAVKPDLKDLFIKEVFNWTSFGVHQNIVKCHFAQEIEGVLFVAAEYVEGTNGRNTLSDFLDERIPLYLLIKWGIQFCFGMNHCTKKGMIAHGDIKPDNLLVDLDSNLKISDFGLSKSYLNQEKTGGGTPLYYSPEQIIDSTKIDHRSDIYSFGIVLYQLISGGVSPYNFTTYEELINAHFKQPIKKLNHPLFHIISKCLRKSPDERYQQYRLLFKAIVEVAKENDITIPKQIETRDDKLEELYLLSTSLSAIGHKDDALKAINQYLTYQPDHSSAWTQKGRLEYEIGNIEVALNATKKSIALYPYSSQATNNLGAIYTKIEDWENAKTCLLKSVELSPNNSGALMNLGMVLLRTQNNNEAKKCLLRCHDLSPGKKSLKQNTITMIDELLKKGDWQNAKPLLEKMTEQEPQEPNHWFNLGLCYYNTSQKFKAIKSFEQVIDIEPTDRLSYQYLIKSYGELGEFDEALKYADVMVNKKIEPVIGINFRAQMMAAKGELEEAISFIYHYANQNREIYILWHTFSDLLAKAGKHKDAYVAGMTAKSALRKQNREDSNDFRILEDKLSRYAEILGL